MDLVVIILSYNTKDVTDRCLTRLKIAKSYCEKKLGNKVQIIVLDNASTDGSVQMIKQNHTEVKLIISKENTGFAKGNNLVMAKVKQPFILLLNSDVYVGEDTLYKTLAYFRVNKNCDVLGPRLNYASGRLQLSGGNLPTPVNIIFWIMGFSLVAGTRFLVPPYHPKHRSFFAKAHPVGWVMGAFMVLKKEVFQKTGGFDEHLFMHMEEIEWCKRIKDGGYRIWYVPQVAATHLHGASSDFDLTSSFLNELKGVRYYLGKHYPDFYSVTKIFLILGLILRVLVFFLLGRTKRASVYLVGLKVI